MIIYGREIEKVSLNIYFVYITVVFVPLVTTPTAAAVTTPMNRDRHQRPSQSTYVRKVYLMDVITSKKEINPIIINLVSVFKDKGADLFIKELDKHLLQKKVKFPILEYAAKELNKVIPGKEIIRVTDRVIELDEIGSYVIAGINLQIISEKNTTAAINRMAEYILRGDKWYACDIMSERVLGYSLLKYPEKTIPILKKLSGHTSIWIQRSVGVAAHYATKKGLGKGYVEEVFELLLRLSQVKHFYTKKGIGWAGKTMAKFHPDIIKKYHTKIFENSDTKQWFKTKVNIGLKMSENIKQN